jgi:hypothetical protein
MCSVSVKNTHPGKSSRVQFAFSLISVFPRKSAANTSTRFVQRENHVQDAAEPSKLALGHGAMLCLADLFHPANSHV